MIDAIVVGAGTNRKVIQLVRDRAQRASLAGAIKGHLFPTPQAHRKAMDKGARRAAAYRREKRAAQ